MTIAFTIGAYRLCDFIRLGIHQIQKLSPDSPILVSDDPSQESGYIKKAAEDAGCFYRGANVRRGHFAADFQSMMNCLAFAKAAEADIAVKVSQRFIFRKPEAIDVIRKCFEDPNVMMATPGQPRVTSGGKAQQGFGAFGILTDVVCFRVGAITPEELLVMYRARILREKVPWKDFIECTVDELHTQRFPGKTSRLDSLTNQPDPRDPIYLRRYQNNEKQYRALASDAGIAGQFPLDEWGRIEGRNYLCRPLVV